MNGTGEAAITLWYSSRVLYSRLTRALSQPGRAPRSTTQFPRHNFIDDLVLAKLKACTSRLRNSADDATFLRRAYLDAAGILPTSEEVENFLADTSPDKRAKLIDRLLERDEFVDYWAYKWSDLLLVSSRKLQRHRHVGVLRLDSRSASRTTSPGTSSPARFSSAPAARAQNGALNYFVLHKDPIDLTENATASVPGPAHHLRALPQSSARKVDADAVLRAGQPVRARGREERHMGRANIVFAKATGDILHPRLRKPLPPTPLDGQSMPLDSTDDRRVRLRQLAHQPAEHHVRAHPRQSRLGQLHGPRPGGPGGRSCAPPIPPPTKSCSPRSRKDFVDHGYDVKRLIRTIMNSGVYQLSTDANATNQIRQHLLFEAHRAAPAGGGDAGCHVAGDRRAHDVRRLSGGHARAAVAGYAGEVANF